MLGQLPVKAQQASLVKCDVLQQCEYMFLAAKSRLVNFPNICFLPSALSTNSFATSIKLVLSTLCLWTWSTNRWFILLSVVVDLKHVFTRFKAEKDLSLIAFVAGITKRIFTSFQITSEMTTFLESSSFWRNCITESRTLNRSKSNCIDVAVGDKRGSYAWSPNLWTSLPKCRANLLNPIFPGLVFDCF